MGNTAGFTVTQDHLHRHLSIINELIQSHLTQITISENILCLNKIEACYHTLMQELFHAWLSNIVATISHTRTLVSMQSLLTADRDRYPKESINGYRLLRYRQHAVLLILPEPIDNITGDGEWIDLGPLVKIDNPKETVLSIEFLGTQAEKYKKQLQKRAIPHWIRCYLPIINGKLIIGCQDMHWIAPTDWMFWLNEK
jgi:hypothetical protein